MNRRRGGRSVTPARLRMRATLLLLAVVAGASTVRPDDRIPDTVPAHPQRDGDPDVGYRMLLSGSWVGCGIPALYYDWFKRFVPSAHWPETLPGRPPGDEDLPYFLNRFSTNTGVEVLAPNCLYCHAGRINGELVVGLGNADGSYHVFDGSASTIAAWIHRLRWLYFWSPKRMREMQKVGERMAAVAPYIGVEVQGANPTHNLAWALIMHRDRHTLAWMGGKQIEEAPILGPPSDVPPWWRMAKKNALFAAAGGQGDHTGFTAVNSALCVDRVEDFSTLYEYFGDIHAYIRSIQPPPYPYAIDHALRRRGEEIFHTHCSGCHGTYHTDPSQETYPNRLVPLEVVKTDPELARYNVVTSQSASDWLNESVFTRFGEYKPFLGYVAPPLDGIWATAPYLHNGSVPTLRALLKSSERPTYWTRSYDSTDFDPDAVGWKHAALPNGRAARHRRNREARRIVDTTLYGMSNQGHTFSDGFAESDLLALLEYLKTI